MMVEEFTSYISLSIENSSRYFNTIDGTATIHNLPAINTFFDASTSLFSVFVERE